MQAFIAGYCEISLIFRVFRERKYEIEFVRAEKEKIIFNGRELEGNVLPVGKLGKTNIVTVYYAN